MAKDEIIASGDFAFPSGDGKHSGSPNHCYGMTLRDWFAGQVLASGITMSPPKAAEWAYQVADAMLSARALLLQHSGGEK